MERLVESTPMGDVRMLYSRVMVQSRKALQSVGALGVLDKYTDRRPVHFLRSQFAIYDFEDLATLDSPWWTYGAIDVVDEWLASREHTRAFEWGAGSSTLWLENRVDELTSVEHDAEFAAMVGSAVSSNVNLLMIPPEPSENPKVASGQRDHPGLDFTKYVDAINSVDGDFDLIGIDGRARPECLYAAIGRLSSDGIIVFDNSDRDRYAASLATPGLSVETYRGWAPALPIKSSTSLVRVTQERSSP